MQTITSRPAGATDVDGCSFAEPIETEEDWSDLIGRELRYFHSNRKYHDRDSFFCDIAGGEDCLKLGHVMPPEGWGSTDDDYDLHPTGWDYEHICPTARYGPACSNCEGECELNTVDPMPVAEFWERVSFDYRDRA
jgi:hypothetical protein